jgi:hypothetical protein
MKPLLEAPFRCGVGLLAFWGHFALFLGLGQIGSFRVGSAYYFSEADSEGFELVDSITKATLERIAQANGRLKSANVGLSILLRNSRLYLRGTLPPKPGSLKDKAFQQEIALGFLGIRANPAGVSAAEREARRVGIALQDGTFDWRCFLKPEAVQKMSLLLWDKYVAYKSKSVAVTTVLSTYAKTRAKLVKWNQPIEDKLAAYRLSMIRVMGDSMAPTLDSGDMVIVDESVKFADRIVEGIFVLGIDGYLRVKRLERMKERIRVLSDNPAYRPEVYRLSQLQEEFSVLGRVVAAVKPKV